jgi:small conductance mechanosensitive channel
MKQEIETFEKLFNVIIEFIVNYGFQVFGAIVILIIGVIIARWLAKVVINFCQKRNMDITFSKFLGNIVKILVLVFVLIVAMGKFGISIAPFIAALGALAFGASFALQGPLSNYGAGLMIIIARPFVVGDTITVKNVSGIVEEVTLATTILTTEDGEKITIPNKHIVGEILNNSFANRVVENTVGISYNDDPEKAINVIKETLKQFSQISSDPAPQIGIQEFGNSSINIGMRYWVPTKEYFGTLYEVNLAVYKALAAAQISIPFPQQDIHIISQPQQK